MQKSSNDLFSRIFESSREFKKVTTITTCAMFGALSVVLGYYSFKITPNLKIGFGSIPNMLVDYLFGPVVGGLFGGAMDVIKFMLKPDGGFMPGFTFNAMLAAFIYGLFFPAADPHGKARGDRSLQHRPRHLLVDALKRKGIFSNSASPRHQEPDPVAGGLPDLLPRGENLGTGRSV